MAYTIVAVIGDTHAGGTTALSTPKFGIHTARAQDTQIAEATLAQKWLYTCWIDYWDYIKRLCGIRGQNRKHRLVVVHLGEFCDGLHHNTVQVANEIPDQMRIAEALHNPVANMADGGFFACIGTEAHAGDGGRIDVEVAQNIGAKEIDYEIVLNVDGIVMDFTHHGRAGQRDWTSSAAAQAAEIVLDYAKEGLPPPRYAFRGHNHIIDDSGEKLEGTRVICTPS